MSSFHYEEKAVFIFVVGGFEGWRVEKSQENRFKMKKKKSSSTSCCVHYGPNGFQIGPRGSQPARVFTTRVIIM